MKTIFSSRRAHHLARLSAFLIVAALIVGMAGCGPLPSEIHDWHDLDAIRDNLSGSYILMNDLDSTTAGYTELAGPTANGGKGWQPIVAFNSTFTGTFDGQGHEIRDLFINRPDESGVALFLVVDEGGRIENIGMVNVTATGDDMVGGLVVTNAGNVNNCYSTGSVTGGDFVGGLVGINYGTVSDSYSTSNVTGFEYVGGLVGENAFGTVSYSYSKGNVTGNSSVGGLVGFNHDGTVSNSFWDIETSEQATSDGGTGKNTTEMKDIDTFSGAGWNIIEVALNQTNPAYIWNIVDNVTYPFLSWEAV